MSEPEKHLTADDAKALYRAIEAAAEELENSRGQFGRHRGGFAYMAGWLEPRFPELSKRLGDAWREVADV